VDTHLRYQRLRVPFQLELSEVAGAAALDIVPHEIPGDVLGFLIDWLMATALRHFGAHLGHKPRGLQVWLSYPEQPHHRELAALFEGEIVFDAPCIRLRVPTSLLDVRLSGDPHLANLSRGQLDARLRSAEQAVPGGLIDRVRERIAARLDQDASLPRVARDLRMSPRTLQRQLAEHEFAFNVLVDDVRRTQALKWMREGGRSVPQLAEHLGYADASSFRRAFRRWTGLAPARFRASQPAASAASDGSPALARDVPRSARKVSGA
jgi:AraC-like DNA-binding protein